MKPQIDVAVVLLDGGFASTAIGPTEVFYSAGVLWNLFQGTTAQPRFRVRTASVDGRPVNNSGFALVPECAIADIDGADVVILASTALESRERIARETPLVPWLREQHARGAKVAGICASVVFLAEAGLLDGRRATTHWAVADEMQRRFPQVLWQTEQFVTEDRGVFCSGGVYAAIDLSLYLVEKFCGREIALQCARSLLLSMPRSEREGYAVLPLSRPHTDEKIRRAEALLRASFERELPVEALASHVGMSPRNFIRRFKAATGRVPGAYLRALRMDAARELFEEGRTSIQDVCAKVGYADAAFFRGLFKRHTGMTPAEYRARFAHMSFERGELSSGQPVA